MDSIKLKLTALLNAKGDIFAYNANLDPDEKYDPNSIKFPIAIKKGEIDRVIMQFRKNNPDISNATEIVIHVAIQNSTFSDKACRMEPIKNPPRGPALLEKEHSINIIAEMLQGMRVLVQETTL
jgi:hypothetical protein